MAPQKAWMGYYICGALFPRAHDVYPGMSAPIPHPLHRAFQKKLGGACSILFAPNYQTMLPD